MANNPPGYPPGGSYPPGSGYPPGGAPPGAGQAYGQPPSAGGGPAGPGYGPPQGPQGYGPPQGPQGYGPPQGPQGYGPPQGPQGYGPPQGPPQGYGPPPGPGPGYGPPPGTPPGYGPGYGPPPGAPGAGPGYGPPPGGVAPALQPFGGNVSRSGGFKKLRLIVSIVAVALIAIGGSVAGCYFYTHPQLHMINTTGRDGVSIFIDGESVAAGLRNAMVESQALTSSAYVASGTHKVEAKDASGKVIESFSVEFASGSNGYLFAPMHNRDICFFIQADQYGAGIGGTAKDQLLDQNRNFWLMPSSIDFWFQDNPNSVKLGKGQKSAVKRALRHVRCSAL